MIFFDQTDINQIAVIAHGNRRIEVVHGVDDIARLQTAACALAEKGLIRRFCVTISLPPEADSQ